MFFYFFWQIVINMGMVLGLMPVVGIPLPFISYGGSATLVEPVLLVGLVLNVSMRRYVFKQGVREHASPTTLTWRRGRYDGQG